MKKLLLLLILSASTFASAQTEDTVYYKFFSDIDNIAYVHIVSEDNYNESNYCQGYFRNFTAAGSIGYERAVNLGSERIRTFYRNRNDGPILHFDLPISSVQYEAFSLDLDHVFQVRNDNGAHYPYGVMHPASAFDLSCDR